MKPYADGLKGYGFPAPSPDGKRLSMMRFQPGKRPSPWSCRSTPARGSPPRPHRALGDAGVAMRRYAATANRLACRVEPMLRVEPDE